MDEREWNISLEPPPKALQAAAEALQARGIIGYYPILSRLIASCLWSSLTDAERVEVELKNSKTSKENVYTRMFQMFLTPTLENMEDPSTMYGVDKACQRILRAIQKQEKIVVYADYDTDGVTAAALMFRILRALGIKTSYYLPSRLLDGYGISDEFVQSAIKEKFDLVLTVDCGISECDHIGQLMNAGVDVIVTDHHEIGAAEVPKAVAIVNPKVFPARASSFRELAGVGVAFKLAWALCRASSGGKIPPRLQEELLNLLPLAAIGSIADVVPLTGENRIIAALGMQRMRNACPGIAALLSTSRLDGKELTAREIAFAVSPRLNAAGRMGSAKEALRLLIEDDPMKAQEKAERLDKINRERQEECEKIQHEALEIIGDADSKCAVAVARSNWHKGMLGIVAGQLAEMLGKPAAAASIDENTGLIHGSARGIGIYEAMAYSERFLLRWGGHKQAAGFTLYAKDWDEWRALFYEGAARLRTQSMSGRVMEEERSLRIDMCLSLPELASVSSELPTVINLCRPFGYGNPEPLFLAEGVKITNARLMGSKAKHFSFMALQEGLSFRSVVFNKSEWFCTVDQHRSVRTRWDLAYTPRINDYNGVPRLELHVTGMRLSN